MTGTPFDRFAGLCEALTATSSRDAKIDLVAAFLGELDPDERAAGARFVAGQPLSPLDARSLDIGYATLEDAGDDRQASLTPGPLTIRGLGEALGDLADVSGRGSTRRREAILGGLLGRLDDASRPWLRRLLGEELRTGVQAGLVLEAIAQAADADPEAVRYAHMVRGDLGEVAHLAIDGGPEVLEDLELEIGRPIRPMLAGRAEDVADAIVELGGPVVFEHKLDGARIQIHKAGDQVHVFSRRLTDVTESLPEAVDLARELSTTDAIVEGEVVGYDAAGRPLPFQDLMRRFRRVHETAAEATRVPVRVHLFDCLRSFGETLIDTPLSERHARLREIAPDDVLVERLVTSDPTRARELFDQAREAGHEGLIAKDPDSAYVPGRRGTHWLKLKPHETLDLVVLGAEWGHGRREGWLSNLHLGVRVPEADEDALVEPSEQPTSPVTRREGYVMVGKTFKGLTDEQLATLTDRLQALAECEEDWGVVARPDLVVEVAFDEVQTSPVYESGFALRFARVTAIREDKPADEAARLADVAERFQAARDRKGTLPDARER